MKNTSGNNDPRVPVEHALTSRDNSPTEWRRALLIRVDEYESQGLAHPESFEALMAAVQADLFRTACATEDAAIAALMGHTRVDSISDLEPAIDRHLGVARRIIRNARFEYRDRKQNNDV